ncbi:MAG: PAS domain-containing protein [Phycisphaeraceae bacterium]|nr:MAG: PAS domain-containing protein [Phycisphaeraceae bacterium]
MTSTVLDRATAVTPSNRPSTIRGLSPDEIALTLDTVNAGVAALGPDNGILWANRRWCDLVGISPERVGSATLQEAIQGPRLKEFDTLIRRARESGRAIRFKDAWEGRSCETTLRPLSEGKLLMVVNSLIGSPAEDEAGVERVEITSMALGPLDKLSKREREILIQLGVGQTIKQIAENLARSEKTIEGHRDSIYRKLGVSSRAELALRAIRSGLMGIETPQDAEHENAD